MVNAERKTSGERRRNAWVQLLSVIGILVAFNIIASVFYKRIDITADNRYTLSQPTINMLNGLEDVVFFKVYLTGEDLPPGFRKLSRTTLEILNEFRRIAGDKIQYEFINPDDMPDAGTRRDLYKQLASQGLVPVNLEVNEADRMEAKIIFPGAIVTMNNENVPVELLQQQLGNVSPEEVLHKSEVAVEYELINAIRRLQIEEKPKVAIIQGHGELAPEETQDIYNTLQQYYTVDYVDLPRYKVGRLDPYAAIIIAKPDSFFTELEKYKIDQYVMHGGKILWCVDALNINPDSLRAYGNTFSTDKQLNIIEDFLFKYGAKLNYNLVQDLNSHYIPVVSNYGGMQRRNLLKWPYYPVVVPNSDHPIVHNLSAIWFQYTSTIDTVSGKNNPEVKKTILLQTSPYTRIPLNPVRVDLRMAASLSREEHLFTQGSKNLAVLLEGNFNSNFRNRRPTAETLASGDYGEFKDKSVPTKMIVVSDGDVIRNGIRESREESLPLGFDPYTNQTFGNKTFILNSMDYLVDKSGLITLRSKDYKLRLLNSGRVKAERLKWQIINIVVPVILLILFGMIFNYVRKRRFAG